MSVFLTGFMGTGKTTIGRQLAQRLGKGFVDTDQRVEQLEGRSVADIFAAAGEAYFRELERRVVAEAVKMDAVVATGGGAIVDAANFERMHAAGPIICLTADVAVILQRTADDTSRPLLGAQERRKRIEDLLRTRSAAYARADVTIDTSTRSIDDILDDIVAFLQRESSRRAEDRR
jgi:shikimate kinase